ncbi:methyl-accepting chemotaxis protein [Oleiphilus messinensis]|nr:methyl-accepting chemotaxis protein [Oleiphilus messinensis]
MAINLTLKKMLFGAFALVILLTIVANLIITSTVSEGHGSAEREKTALAKMEVANRIVHDFDRMRFELTNFAIGMTDQAEQAAQEYGRKIRQDLDQLADLGVETEINEPLIDQYYQAKQRAIGHYINDNRLLGNQMNAEAARLAKEIQTYTDELNSELTRDAENAAEIVERSFIQVERVLLIMVVAVVGVSMLLGYLIIRYTGQRLGGELSEIQHIAEAISRNRLDLDLREAGESVGIYAAMVTMRDNLRTRMAREAEQLKETNKIKQALDICATNVMMADADFNIVYMNNAVKKMFKAAEPALQSELKHFNADNLMGQCVDIFHKNKQHQRQLIAGLTDVYRGQIKVGGRTFNLIATPVVDESGERLGTVVEWEDVTDELARQEQEQMKASENERIRQALDNVSANVMVADADRNIIYMNDAVRETLTDAEADIQKALPNFAVNKLIGGSIDQFHVNPSHQVQILNSLKAPHAASIVVGGRHMDLNISPVIGDDNERLGSVVEWKDRTHEVSIEREVDEIIAAASKGDLSKRIALQGKAGFFAKLSEGINALIDTSERILSDVGATFAAMSQGNLTQTINRDYSGEFDKIKQDANKTLNQVNEVISQISQAAATVSTAADEIARGNADLSERTERQASALEETASSMEEMTSTVKQSSENANAANQLANNAREKAQMGGEVVKQAVVAMNDILKASRQINDIIAVIDEIAFQTNLLALNAAVEAARAGEQGRGFAVVAGEVRNLSKRSADAARKIKELIKDSMSKVEVGSDLVNQSGETLTSIVSAVERVAKTVADIDHSASEQTDGITQINQAIAQMDENTQQNAAMVEESTSASQAMKEQATHMTKLVSFFSLSQASLGPGSEGGSRGVLAQDAGYQTSASVSYRNTTKAPAAIPSEWDDEWDEF